LDHKLQNWPELRILIKKTTRLYYKRKGMAGTESNGGATTSLLRAEGDRERPREPWKGEFVKSIVYAGLDAIVTCFSLISSISASTRSSGICCLYFSYKSD
jgi:hypothetical protein